MDVCSICGGGLDGHTELVKVDDNRFYEASICWSCKDNPTFWEGKTSATAAEVSAHQNRMTENERAPIIILCCKNN